MCDMSFLVTQFPRVSLEIKCSQMKQVRAGFYCSCPVLILVFHNKDILYNQLESVSKAGLLKLNLIIELSSY